MAYEAVCVWLTGDHHTYHRHRRLHGVPLLGVGLQHMVGSTHSAV